jgi:hypothetical protein
MHLPQRFRSELRSFSNWLRRTFVPQTGSAAKSCPPPAVRDFPGAVSRHALSSSR